MWSKTFNKTTCELFPSITKFSGLVHWKLFKISPQPEWAGKSIERIMPCQSQTVCTKFPFLFSFFFLEMICTWHNVIPNPGNARWIFHSAPLMGCVLNTACQRQINYELLYHKGHYCFIKEHSSVNRAMETRLDELVLKPFAFTYCRNLIDVYHKNILPERNKDERY